jgi:hypothetical protein
MKEDDSYRNREEITGRAYTSTADQMGLSILERRNYT